MAKDNAWKTVAEVYRNREHSLIQKLQQYLELTDGDHLYGIENILEGHLKATGREPGKAIDTPVIISPVDDARTELLALLGASEGQQRASSGPIQVRTRKVRSDKGKARGPRKGGV